MSAILIPGTYLTPGVGEVLITASLAILLGKAAVEIRTEIYSRFDGLNVRPVCP